MIKFTSEEVGILNLDEVGDNLAKMPPEDLIIMIDYFIRNLAITLKHYEGIMTFLSTLNSKDLEPHLPVMAYCVGDLISHTATLEEKIGGLLFKAHPKIELLMDTFKKIRSLQHGIEQLVVASLQEKAQS